MIATQTPLLRPPPVAAQPDPVRSSNGYIERERARLEQASIARERSRAAIQKREAEAQQAQESTPSLN